VIDAPGPWGTGPFTLAEGYSSLRNEMAVIRTEPFAATWLDDRQVRADRVVLEANPRYWNTERGPQLQRLAFRNDLDTGKALEAVCDREGEVDIASEVSPTDAQRVQQSANAHLVSTDSMRVLVGMINRDAADVPLDDVRARQALNLAVDREALIRDVFAGYASPLAGFTPRFAAGVSPEATPYPHESARAVELLSAAGWPRDRALRLAAPPDQAEVARALARQYEHSLGVRVELSLPDADEMQALTRRLVEKRLRLPWDVLLHAWIDLSADAPPGMIHREFVGETGAFRSGPEVPEFDRLFGEYSRWIDPTRFGELAQRIDQYCYDEALAVFLCSPQALYAVNDHVNFVAHATTLELAETSVDEGHWSRR
jgi:peptide/nickel transport system substrate-binding protein